MLRTVAAIAFVAVTIVGPAYALDKNSGTPEARAACTKDAFKFCTGSFPDADAVFGCLQQHRAELSAACRPSIPAAKSKGH